MPRNAVQEKAPSEAQIAARQAGADRLRAAREARSKAPRQVAPVVIRKETDTRAHQTGQDHPRDLPGAGKARIEPARIEVVGRPLTQEKAEALIFNEDMLTIVVHESTNPLDDPRPAIWNDGRRVEFERGVECQVKRKFVEVLARMKKTVYTQQKYENANGDKGYRNIPQTALVHPFSVLHDPSPRGRDWLKAILAEA